MSEKGAGLEMTVTRRAEAYIVAQTTKRDEHRSVARLCALAKHKKIIGDELVFDVIT